MAALTVLLAALLAAPAPPPESEWLTAYPKLEPFVMVGKPRDNDQWARLRISVDRRGVPTDCRIVESNLRHTENRWRACSTVMRYWSTQPATRGGKRVASVVERILIAPGRETRAAARRRAESEKMAQR